QVSGVEQFLAGALGRFEPVIGLGEQFVQQPLIDGSGRGDGPVDVVTGVVQPEAHHRGVDERVGGTDVVGGDVLGVAYDGDVGDAAQVERRGGTVGFGQQQGVHVRNQWGAVPADGHVADPHVRQHR